MIKDKKGFTLIEILAAITILGILMAVAITSVTKVIENGKEKHYTTAEENMTMAGQSYVQQNRSYLPKAIGQKKKIKLSLLVENNYIEPIKDYNKNECDLENSYVQVYKYSQKDYSYVSYLECPNYNSKATINNMTPEIDASIVVDSESEPPSARITITGNDKLMSYSYIIYKNNKEVKNTGSVAVKGFAESQSLNIPLDDYIPGNIKITITATNTYGNTKNKTLTQGMQDTVKPTCVYINEADKSDKTWTNTDRTITVGCDDGTTGSGCTRETYSKTFKSTTEYGYITIEDEVGNKTQCRVSVFVDKDAPNVPTVNFYKWLNSSTRPTENTNLSSYTSYTPGAESWSDKKIFSKPTSTDNGSGVTKYIYTTQDGVTATNVDTEALYRNIEANGTSYIKWKACDVAGNCSAYSNNYVVNVDTERPTCGTIILTGTEGNNGWYRSNVIVTKINGSDEQSGHASTTLNRTSVTGQTTGTVVTLTTTDKAGNTCIKTKNVKIDTIPPTITCNADNAYVKYCDVDRVYEKSGCSAKAHFLCTNACGETGWISTGVFSVSGGNITTKTSESCDDRGVCGDDVGDNYSFKISEGRCKEEYSCTHTVSVVASDDAGNTSSKDFVYYFNYDKNDCADYYD